ncbi:hypothetical protein TeGR_g6826, partial [Tetraparma gracilis]
PPPPPLPRDAASLASEESILRDLVQASDDRALIEKQNEELNVKLHAVFQSAC